jgi:hypothetical protein
MQWLDDQARAQVMQVLVSRHWLLIRQR